MFFRALLQVSVIAGLVLLTSSPLAAAPIRVTGRVFDWAQESGVAGVRIELFPAYEGPARPAPLASTRTDAEGSFEIAALESGCFRLVVRAKGYLTMEHPLAPLVEDRHLPTTSLVPSRPWEVRTVGPNGRPVAGAEVRILPRVPQVKDRPWGWSWTDRAGVTGADGKLSLPVHERETLEVAASAPRFLEKRVTLTLQSAVVRLSPTREQGRTAASKPVPPRRISGKVTDSASGKPVAGALVWSGWPPVAPPVRADGEGRFQLDVPDGTAGDEIWLESGAAGFLPAERQYVKQGATQTVLVKLDPATEISGRVTDPAGRLVAGASIQFQPPLAGDRYQDFSEARASADGRFRLPGLKPGTDYKLTAHREGFERTSVPAQTPRTGQPPPSPIEIVLGEGRTAFGRIVDAEGRPVAGFELFLFDRLTFRDQHRATTNEQGRFEVRHLSPGTYTLTASHPEHIGLEIPEVEIPTATGHVDLGDLKLPADGAIEGRVTDTRGRSVEGAEVHATEADEFDGHLNIGGGLGHEIGLRPVRTSPDGSFRVPGLKLGEIFDLRVKHPDHAEATVAGVEVPPKEPLRIEMKAGHRLTGRVVDTEGEPVAGASLTWLERTEGIAGLLGSQRPLGVTDAEGRFQASGLPAGGLDLEVSAEGYQTAWMDGLRIPDDGDLEDVKVVLGKGSWLDVRVRNAEGEPVRDCIVFAHPQDLEKERNPRNLLLRAFSHCQTDSQGRCRLNLPEPGSYTVKIEQVEQKTSVNVTASPGGTPLEIHLPRGFEVSGRVIGKDGAGVPETFVESLSENQGHSAAPTRADGSFVFPGLAAGRHRLRVRQPGVGEASLDVEVTDQPVRGLELRLSGTDPAAVLTGRLTGLPPEELAGATVEAQSPETYSKSGRVERDGGYRIEDLEPGEWTVSARTPSGRHAQGRVRIETGTPAATLDLDFAAGLTLTGHVLVDGSPLGAASVISGNRAFEGSGRHARTAYDGSFTIRDLPPGPLTLLVFGSPGISAIRAIQLEESEEITVEITTGTFKATVLSAAGEPLEGAVATLEPWNPDPELQVPFAAVSVRSGQGGTLDAGRLAPGTYKMELRKEGFQPRQETVEIRPGGATVLDVRLAPRE